LQQIGIIKEVTKEGMLWQNQTVKQ